MSWKKSSSAWGNEAAVRPAARASSGTSPDRGPEWQADSARHSTATVIDNLISGSAPPLFRSSLDMLNVFNNTNYSDYQVDYGSKGNVPANPVTFNQVGNILGVPRTLKLQGGVKF
jgi:hypothetical protein